MQAPLAHILPLTTLRRERLLPVLGRVVARLDQKVGPLDVVAETIYGRRHVMIDAAQALGVSSPAVDDLIVVKSGDTVNRGDVVAQRSGLSRKAVYAPDSGRIVVIGGGKVLMELGEETFELRANMPGTVTRLVADKGVEITFSGALVQGVWGNGRTDSGMLLPVVRSPEEPLLGANLDVSQRGAVLLAGFCDDPNALQAAADLPVRGLILGCLSPALVGPASQVPYPVVVVDGFGRRAFDAAAFRLLTTNAKREACLNAQAFDRFSGAHPEIYIPLPVSQEPAPPRELENFAPEQQVRLLRAPFAGGVGTLLTVRPGLTTMPSGLRLPAAEVRLESGERVIVPLVNLEVLG